MMQEVLLREGMLSQLKTWRGMEMERIITARHETIHNRKKFLKNYFFFFHGLYKYNFFIDCIYIFKETDCNCFVLKAFPFG